jgi:hypothetical protein
VASPTSSPKGSIEEKFAEKLAAKLLVKSAEKLLEKLAESGGSMPAPQKRALIEKALTEKTASAEYPGFHPGELATMAVAKKKNRLGRGQFSRSQHRPTVGKQKSATVPGQCDGCRGRAKSHAAVGGKRAPCSHQQPQ